LRGITSYREKEDCVGNDDYGKRTVWAVSAICYAIGITAGGQVAPALPIPLVAFALLSGAFVWAGCWLVDKLVTATG